MILESNNKQGKLAHIEGRIIVKVWLQEKNHHTFSHGLTIRLERQYNNFNRRETEPIQGIVVSGESIPEGAIILFHHNATHANHEIFNVGNLNGEEIASQVKYFSILEKECYAWKMPDGEWQPTKGFAFAYRIFKPYIGSIQGIEPTLIKDSLWMRTGQYKNMAVRTVKAADYEIIFREPETGREARIIRCRPDGDEADKREEEVIAIDHRMTKQILKGELLIGLSKSDCKQINEIQYAG